MSLTASEMSPADIAACTGNCNSNSGNAWGGDGAWWIIILFLFVFCGWGNGFGGFGGNGGGINSPAGQGALTRGDLCMDMNFQEVKREVQNANDAVNLGFSNLNSTICNAAYENAGLINGLSNTVQQGFNGTNVALLQGFNAVQSQAAQCCCDQKAATADLKYTIASEDCATRSTIQNGIRDVLENQNANARAVLDKLTAQELAAKDAQITALNNQLFRADLAASQQAQNNYLVNTLRPCPIPAYQTCNPWASQASYGSCGCGSFA